MGVFSKLFGSNKNEEKLEGEEYIKTIIEASDDEPLAVSESNIMYAGYNELGGYYYLQTVVVGSLKTKTKDGAKLTIEGKNDTLELNSDMLELESDPAHPLKGYVTKVDFQIEKDAVEKLKRSNIKNIQFIIKNHDISFSIYSEK